MKQMKGLTPKCCDSHVKVLGRQRKLPDCRCRWQRRAISAMVWIICMLTVEIEKISTVFYYVVGQVSGGCIRSGFHGSCIGKWCLGPYGQRGM